MFDLKEFQQRREQLLASVSVGIAIIPTALEAIRNRDSHYPYRFDSYFYYLTGFKEPESVLLLVAGDNPKSILFCRDKDIEREIWDGFRFGADAARETFGFDEAYSINELDAIVLKLLANQPKLYCSLGENTSWDARVMGWMNTLRAQARSGVSAPDNISDVRKLMDEMRLFKSPFEIDLMRQSANIAASAHNRAMQYIGSNFTRPNMMEYEIEAEFLHEFYRKGAQAPAYTSIVASGANACTLHYTANNAKLNNGDLLLIDAGCELEGYASDITRTFPVNGKFTPVQKDVYDLVLAAQAAAISQVKPQSHWNAPHEAALDVLVQGFIDMKLCKGSKDAVLESGDYRQFYMHRTGHWLGLDVHDAGEYKVSKSKDKLDNWRMLEPNMTLTVEPGCYIRPAENVPKAFWNIGIRIEDDVLVTQNGCEVLTKNAVKTVADIEAIMANR
ncbi:aminopeptidase P N-terminal domain-containing protein [Methylotenera sp.]|uniref:aminopeptidase P N-terminal domain-containing protein n=1 Tax=Methylotenera sp. TaxID=2051956 RepID=UPI00272FE81C|nr:aminopeptidase P N-terminal domain-containing protein [Methylotenera sp.]MDP2230127.1 aminopeptidase P N-terminal domain-containing protein [Methylotenera sp.]MDP3142255.1 aminopeptidase P N-terminal domain-containing protein [Methylotenera sp.]